MSAPDRRAILKLLAGGAAASVAACRRPDEKIYPLTNQPEGDVPGEVRRYATAVPLAGYGRGVTGLVVDGRPIKLEGLAAHPASLGATDLFAEVSILDLYDPQRARAVSGPEGPASWQDFSRALWERVAPRRGEGFSILTGRVTSPTVLARLQALKAALPGMRQVRWEPFDDDAVLAGTQMALGRRLTPRPRLADADVVLCLGADPLGPGPEQVALARAWSERRRRRRGGQRLYVVEPSLTATGAMADRRAAAGSREMALACRALAEQLAGHPPTVGAEPVEARVRGTSFDKLRTNGFDGATAALVQHAAQHLTTAKGRALILAGERQPAEVHAFAAWANAQLGALVDYIAPVDPDPTPHRDGLAALARDLHAGRVDTLLILDDEPAYAAPPELDFANAIKRAKLSAVASRYPGESGAVAGWRLPLSHPLEGWHDWRAPDGTAGVAQPLVRPFYDTLTPVELIDLLMNPAGGPGGPGALARHRETWAHLGEAGWRDALVAGVVPDTAAKPEPAGEAKLVLPPVPPEGLAIEVRPSPTLYDGRFAANAWAQECPDPVTKEVWGASVRLHPADMAAQGLADGDLVTLTRGGSVTFPALAEASQARGVATVLSGYGRTSIGAVADGVGANAWALTGAGPAGLVKAEGRQRAIRSQQQFAIGGEDAKLFPILAPGQAVRQHPEPPTLLPNPPAKDNAPAQWAMAIDTDVCIGCNACVVACQAENNVPAIGPEQQAVGRDMHWLRVDRYEVEGATGFQPVPCMQCEAAPCEPVCPVEASIHDEQGLNLQVYNRCIGTRTCQANCPYKVRRFNFLDYAGSSLWGDAGDASVTAQRNPDVTVRARGVMEKCTYCVQRIEAHNRAADAGGAPALPVTACQAACPTRAIEFGPKDSPGIQAARASPRHYALLEELGTKPRTTYLARRRDPGGA